MGISSNQARLMTLTARQHDLELRAQSISAKKMITSLESQEMAMKYSDALNKYSQMKSGELQNAIEYDVYRAYNPDRYGGASEIIHRINYDNESDFNTAMGRFMYHEKLESDFEYKEYTDEDAADFLRKAQADYDGATAKLSAEEKQLDMELTQINTEHNAVKTEYDAVKSLVSDNTDKSFNVFS